MAGSTLIVNVQAGNEVVFENNASRTDGGVIKALPHIKGLDKDNKKSMISISGNVKFIGNRSAQGKCGGAIYAENSDVTIDGATFENNRALSGGALYVKNNRNYNAYNLIGTTKLFNCVISSNSAGDNATTGYGGALYVEGTDLTLNSCTIKNNDAVDAYGGVYFNGGKNHTLTLNGKYIMGYTDGTFGGQNEISRAEFIAMLARFGNIQKGSCDFTDVPKNHWAYDSIATATKAGWVKGYTDGTFKPEQSITRAEAMAIINRVLDRGVSLGSDLLSYKVWPDNSPSDWYYYEIIEATNDHEYTGTRPNENWTSLTIH